MKDLFGNELPEPPTAASAQEIKRYKRRLGEIPRGYIAQPGSGPSGETCRSCEHFRRVSYANTYFKCDLFRQLKGWTCGHRTDVRALSPACARRKEPDPTTAS